PGTYTMGLVVTGSSGDSVYFPQLANLQRSFNAGTGSAKGLGQLLYDVLVDANGWQIPQNGGEQVWDQMPDLSSFTDLYTTSFNPDAAVTPGWTTVPGVPEESATSIVPAAAPIQRRRRPLYRVSARTTLHRKGP